MQLPGTVQRAKEMVAICGVDSTQPVVYPFSNHKENKKSTAAQLNTTS
jgi:hypothetical protein